MEFWSIIFLSIAISLDGFSVGITYGLRKIKIGFLALILISSISTLAVYLTLLTGSSLAGFLDIKTANYLGSLLLIIMGAGLIYTAYIDDMEQVEDRKSLLLSLKVRPLGIIIQILKEPDRADFDHSGTINLAEALVLGLALALDAAGVGLGAGLSNYSHLLPVIMGIFNFIFVLSGSLIGKKIEKQDALPVNLKIMPGLILIFLGFIKLI